jgi:primosomal protein N' (replication factor Y)
MALNKGATVDSISRSHPYIEVRVLTGISRPLHYGLGPLKTPPQVGSLVRVPLGKRTELAIVSGLTENPDFDRSRIKNLLEVIYPFPLLSNDMFGLASWISRYYGVSEQTVVDKVLPKTLRKSLRAKEISYISISEEGRSVDIVALQKKAPKQAQLLSLLVEQKLPIIKAKTLSALKVGYAAYNSMVEKGWISETSKVQDRIAYEDELGANDTVKQIDFELTEDQATAVKAIYKNLETGAFKTSLLHGVTGSGKTEVYVRAIRKVLDANSHDTVLLLVPEVALAPQTVATLRSRLEALGIQIIVWHSHLSEGERRDGWLKIAKGESRVVVGARSAIFTPLNSLRLIIVDEEHEPAYKQEETPRYHGRDLAVVRAKLNNAYCILGSATPSMESLYNVKAKKYDLIALKNRVDHRQLPKVTIVDMRTEFRKNRKETILSGKLVEGLRNRFELREQSILFLNRRGYATHMICPECGWVAMSDECSVPLTFHRRQNKLKCHLTGYEVTAPQQCPECGNRKIKGEGFGTQKLEDAIRAVIPLAKVFRIDADTMTKKHLFRHVLSDFRSGKLDILVGTQMIAKGLDFPNVTLVGMINADHSMFMEDFRAAERTFQLLVQVSGRAGRGERSGEVIVQTSTPHASPIQYAKKSDFEGFLEEEIEIRREFNYPPFRHLIRHLIRGKSLEKVTYYATQWRRLLDEHPIEATEVRGPIPSSVEKIHGDYRYQLWYFTPKVIATVDRLKYLSDQFKWDVDIQTLLDVDAFNLM